MPEAHRIQAGLAYWMNHVIEERTKLSAAFAPDPVHDLRVALRRCRSLADGIIRIDPHPAWRKLKKLAKPLFSRLGDIRDIHVFMDWIAKLSSPDDAVSRALPAHAASEEKRLKQLAIATLQEFDEKEWLSCSQILSRRVKLLRTDSLVFRHLALERWNEARQLHRQAVRNRSNVAFHRLRIGLKKFRYTVENFLPSLCESWEADLKYLQDLLGEIHDLDMLWATAVQIGAFDDEAVRSRWRAMIEAQRSRRLDEYRNKMLGRDSLWSVWRAALPKGKEVHEALLLRVKTWAAFLDPDFAHARHVSRLALQLYDGLAKNGTNHQHQFDRTRLLLQAAALMHDVGRAKRRKNHHKGSYRLISKLPPPFGWKLQELQQAAAIARYHRGALPRSGQRSYQSVPQSEKRRTVFLAGILRLADALDKNHDGSIHRLEVERTGDFFTVWARCLRRQSQDLQHVAAARHLLESACGRPIWVRLQRDAYLPTPQH
jgi:CHAD domain-containing protein